MQKLIAAGLACLFFTSSTCYAGTIYACRKKIGGTIRIVGASTTCLATERKMSWPDTAEVNALRKEMATLKSLLQHFSRNGNDISITGANLWIKSGTGASDNEVNGLGNLIIGYNELRGSGDDRTGSHNIIIGKWNNHSSYGGLVVGRSNTISSDYASITGGYMNTASGYASSVSGGVGNTASGFASSVSGGQSNTASGADSSVSGGWGRSALGDYDWRAGDSFQEQ